MLFEAHWASLRRLLEFFVKEADRSLFLQDWSLEIHFVLLPVPHFPDSSWSLYTFSGVCTLKELVSSLSLCRPTATGQPFPHLLQRSWEGPPLRDSTGAGPLPWCVRTDLGSGSMWTGHEQSLGRGRPGARMCGAAGLNVTLSPWAHSQPVLHCPGLGVGDVIMGNCPSYPLDHISLFLSCNWVLELLWRYFVLWKAVRLVLSFIGEYLKLSILPPCCPHSQRGDQNSGLWLHWGRIISGHIWNTWFS